MSGQEHGCHQGEQHGAHVADHQDGLAAALVGGQATDQDEPGEEEHRDHLHAQILLLREAQRGHAVGQRPGAQHVEQRVGDAHRAGAEHKAAPVMGQVTQRGLRGAVLGGSLLVDGRLAHAHAHDQADDHEQARQQERDAPAPGEHRVGGKHGVEQQVHAIRAEEPDGRAEVRKAAKQRTLIGRGVLGGHQRGAGPLAGKAQTLAGAAGAQQHHGCGAEHVVPGQQADAKRCGTHKHQGCDQGFLTTEAVAEMAEQQATERAGKEAHRERDERQQRGEHRVGLGDVGEEDEPEVAGRGDGVAVVVVELDGRANHGCDHDLKSGVAFDLRLCGNHGCRGRNAGSRSGSCGGLADGQLDGRGARRCGCGSRRGARKSRLHAELRHACEGFCAARLRVRPLRLPPTEQGLSLLLIVHLLCLSFPATLPVGGAARAIDDRPRKRTLLGKNGKA